jgi:arylsulfatase A
MQKTTLQFLFFVISIASSYAQSRPNIIFILADDLGYMDLGCYGNPFNETPHLDALAKGGIRFTQAYAASTVCSPSRAAIMTGKHPARLKLTNFINGRREDSLSPVRAADWKPYLPTAEITLAERLKTLGYQTSMIGKWHLGVGDSLAPWRQGFDYVRMIGRNGLDYYNYSIATPDPKDAFTDKGTYYLTDRLTDYATEFMGSQQDKQPFFLYLNYSTPHVYLVPRPDKLGKYFRKYEKYEGKYNPNYAAMIESMDDGIGKIIAQLTAQNLLENTLIVFASDNGGVGLPELGPIPTNSEPLRKWKSHIYEGGIRVPTIWFWQGKILPQQTCNEPFSNVDYVPTFMEILGQSAAISPDSRSVASLLIQPQKPIENRPIFWHYPHFSNQLGRPGGGVRLGDWKLVENYETHATELYNLKEDLSESNDLAKKEPARTQQLHSLLKAWQKEVGANMPIQKK